QRAAVRRNGPDEAASGVRSIGQRDLDFGVLRKSSCARRTDAAARRIEPVGAFVALAQYAFKVVGVAHDEGRRVHQNTALLFGFNGKRGDDRSGERLLHALLQSAIAARSAKAQILLREQHARPGTLEINETRTAARTTINAEFDRADALRDGHEVDHLLV